MHLIRIDGGRFVMGESNRVPETLGGPEYLTYGDWDERPVHEVTISRAFYISETEVTIKQFREFRPEYEGSEEFEPYASGVSWNDALAFCRWLSDREGKPYRLPTEAEWEYVCRAGTTTLFSSGNTVPDSEYVNDWGMKNMHTQVREWCLDWHGMYSGEKQTDPVGPEHGLAKVVRGGGLDRPDPYYARSANRAGIAPDFPPLPLEKMREIMKSHEDTQTGIPPSAEKPQEYNSRIQYLDFVRNVLNNQGNHGIGFRVVQAPMPDKAPARNQVPFVQQCVRQDLTRVKTGPDPAKPYFRKRYLLPTPPENTPEEKLYANKATGLHPGILRHHHSPALEVCPNGDLLAVYYTAVSEVTPDVAMIAVRMRFGGDNWDMPEFWLDFPDVDDHAPLLWNDEGTLHFFWGANKLDSGFPFQWISSTDNGASWSKVNFPVFETMLGGHSAQPINTAFRDKNGTIYISSDGVGPESILWISRNDGKTWIDSGGRTGGRHTSFVLLKDGSILGMGGKSSDIDGFMPKSISTDQGKTWEISKTPFPCLGSNQRPSIIRLSSGRLFFAGDFQRIDGFQPRGISQRGAYVALSEDEGKSWHAKKLTGAQEHEDPDHRNALKGATIGYSVARQAPNGMIHLITSMNEPCLHFEMNEAWILAPERDTYQDEDPMQSMAVTIADVKDYSEMYPSGSLKVTGKAGIGNDGRYLKHGTETWYYENGQKQWEAQYELGKKVDSEMYWTKSGQKLWSWEYSENGSSIWTRWWPNGEKKSESTWHNKKCQGNVREWDQFGMLKNQLRFEDGVLVE